MPYKELVVLKITVTTILMVNKERAWFVYRGDSILQKFNMPEKLRTEKKNSSIFLVQSSSWLVNCDVLCRGTKIVHFISRKNNYNWDILLKKLKKNVLVTLNR